MRTDSTRDRAVIDRGELSEIDIQDDIEFAVIQMKAETLTRSRSSRRAQFRSDEGKHGEEFDLPQGHAEHHSVEEHQ